MLRRTIATLGSHAVAATGGLCLEMSPEQRELQQTAHRFAKEVVKPNAAKYDKTMEYPREIFNEAWKLGLLNPHIPEAFGGLALNVMDECLITEELAWGCTGMTVALSLKDCVVVGDVYFTPNIVSEVGGSAPVGTPHAMP